MGESLVLRVLAVGDINADLILTGLASLPQAEQELLADDFHVLIGGQTGTFARALSHLGMAVTFAGRVGDDDYGRQAVAQLQADGVDTSGVIVDSSVRTGVTVVLSTGEARAYATYPGSIGITRRTDVTPDLLAGMRHLHVGSYYLQSGLRPHLPALLADAQARGLTTSLDPGWDPADAWGIDILDALRHTDVFLPNEVEALRIAGVETPGAALEMLAAYARCVVIKRGKRGCLASDRIHTLAIPAFDVPVVDVTSAGDVFNAGFVYAFLVGRGFEEAARFAAACGAMAVTRAGSSGLVPGADAVEAFLVSHHQPEEEKL
jgi:sugar/nucleoside kinase (ribokinase family)